MIYTLGIGRSKSADLILESLVGGPWNGKIKWLNTVKYTTKSLHHYLSDVFFVYLFWCSVRVLGKLCDRWKTSWASFVSIFSGNDSKLSYMWNLLDCGIWLLD